MSATPIPDEPTTASSPTGDVTLYGGLARGGMAVPLSIRADADEPASEGFGDHGVFTYTLLDALAQADGNKDGVIDVKELADYVSYKVPHYAWAVWKRFQVPQKKLTGANFALATRPDRPIVAVVKLPAPAVLASATLEAPVALRQFRSDAAIDVTRLEAGSRVNVIENANG